MTIRKAIKKTIALLLALTVFAVTLPTAGLFAGAATADYYSRVADGGTLDLWKEYFPTESTQNNPLTTVNAGGVWTDKSVFTGAEAFGQLKDPEGANTAITMLDGNKNFLTAMSAIAANKEIVGYSTVPTDTVFILDLSTSMSSNAVTQLVSATNQAITRLQEMNNNNRVGVVLYSGASDDRTYNDSVASLMPIDRYTTTRTTQITDPQTRERVTIGVYVEYSGGTVRLARQGGSLAVSGTGNSIQSESKSHGGATYIQAGLWEALELFNDVPDNDIIIPHGNWQAGEARMPIVVLMSDGAPTLGTSYYDNVPSSTYGYGSSNNSKANAGNGNDTNITAGQGFLVQLTASYVKNQIERKYKVHEEKHAGRSLFYTLGFNIDSIETSNARNIARSVLDPDSSTITDNLWNSYNGLQNNSALSVRVKSRDRYSNNDYIDVSVYKNSYATSKSYVDEYFAASGTGLEGAFGDIVQEILLQSRYYPTHLEGGSPDFSGYVEFTDTLGEYMEVKQIKGILLGNVLFDGHAMASKLNDSTSDGLGTPDSPTDLGNEFIWAVQARLGISDVNEARALVKAAYNAEQICYKEDGQRVVKWSNYIGWYADAAGKYIAHWDENSTADAPAGAVYKIKSYGFLGETTGSIKNSDMMYMSVQVKSDIATGIQTVSWKIPAALVPMVTYLVEVDGTSIDTAQNVRLSVEDENVAPIRLVYETGLRSDLNEFNITRITDSKHIAADGHTRLFWNNYFMIEGNDHTKHKTAVSEFTPNKENERFYYTFDSAVYKKVAENNYTLVTENEGLDTSGTYYHRRYIFSADSTTPIFFYEDMSAASVAAALANGFKDNFENLQHQTVGAWVVPAGTPARELEMYSRDKTNNLTDSAHMIFYPYLTEQNNLVYVDMNLGNNGRLAVTPATGIKISKTVDVFEQGTSDTFRFRITAPVTGSFESWITDLDATPAGESTLATFSGGVYEFELKRDQTFWLTGLDADTPYTVEEISDNKDYKIKSVHLNGQSMGNTAAGTVTRYLIDDIDFVNTAVGEGDLVITKQVVDAAGNNVAVNENIEFTLNVALTDEDGDPVSGTFKQAGVDYLVPANGQFTLKLSGGESFILRGIPEETRYTVTEPLATMPAGFTLNSNLSRLSGIVDSSANDQALVVNTYGPVPTDGEGVRVVVNKEISGNRNNWLQGESYSFRVDRLDVARAAATVVGSFTISDTNTDKTASMTLEREIFSAPGTYYYRIVEVEGSRGGITYDTAERSFSVTVADSDMDGDLEIIAVNNELGTTVSGQWTVTAAFNNIYAPTGSATATVNIQKAINGGHSLAGFRFALYGDEGLENELLRSGITGADGKASISLTYAANRASMAGEKYTYYLAEIKGDNPNITYSTEKYKVIVTVKDMGDGTITADAAIENMSGNTATFTNVYTPSASDYVTLSGKKVISTGNRPLNAGEFTFGLAPHADNPNAPMPAVSKLTNRADGSFAFDAIEFDTVGTYKYVMVEERTNPIGGFTYDESLYTITVEVRDNGDATLTADIISIARTVGAATTNVNDIVFENRYAAAPTKLSLSGTKHLNGKAMTADEFSFTLEAETLGAPLPAGGSSVSNKADGSFTFGEITFTAPGVYLYKVYEDEGQDSRYTYDKSVYTLTVNVTDNSEGKLSHSYTLEKNGNPSGEIFFNNSFVPSPKDYDINAKYELGKELSGRPLKDGEFEFMLINAINGQTVYEDISNDANGLIDIPALTLPEAGTYHYKLLEVVGDERGITYDETVYHVIIGVEQDANGNLNIIREELHKATVVIDQSTGTPVESTRFENITAGGEAVFNNSYAPDPAKVILGGLKHLTGRELKEGEFTFNLYASALDGNNIVKGRLLEQTTNKADGSFSFKTLQLQDTNGTTFYFITEDASNPDSTITYDAKEYMVAVKGTDNLDGTIKVQYEYYLGLDKVAAVEFTNIYTPPIEPEIPKTGDTNDLVLWIALFFVSGGTLGGLTVVRARRRA
ncbi:MAG: hypothetical protein J6B93_03745 [Clostridia bacterium]|nr:hypothetical protein [Clostridia bacterium]